MAFEHFEHNYLRIHMTEATTFSQDLNKVDHHFVMHFPVHQRCELLPVGCTAMCKYGSLDSYLFNCFANTKTSR